MKKHKIPRLLPEHIPPTWRPCVRGFYIGLAVAMLALVSVSFGAMPAARADTFNIADGDVEGLIAAINTANGNGVTDTISLAPGGTYTLAAVDNTTDGPNGLPSIASEITINGNGSTIKRSGTAPKFRIFHVGSIGDLALKDLTISGGALEAKGDINGGGISINSGGTLTVTDSALQDNTITAISCCGTVKGGAIYNSGGGTLTITSSIIRGNRALSSPGDSNISNGGGIFNSGGLVTITSSTFRGNSANEENGGAIYNSSGSLIVTRSTFRINSAGRRGGGIYNGSGSVTLTNSTLGVNSAAIDGGGVYNLSGSVTLTHSTLSGNTASKGGGIFNSSGTANITNAIIAKNPSGSDCSGTITSLGHNLDSDNSCELTGLGDLPRVNPLLGPLQDNGGLTETYAPLPGSPAIDAIPIEDCTETTDQRGVHRPQGANCDIGAVEVGDQPPPFPTGDLNCDGAVNIMDVILLLQHLTDLVAKLPTCVE